MDSIRECLQRKFEGKIPYTELTALDVSIRAHLGICDLTEALTASDETRIEQIVRKVLKSKSSQDSFLRYSKSVLTALFKSLYVRRSLWTDGLVLAPD